VFGIINHINLIAVWNSLADMKFVGV